jgi:hypothetical protein
MEDAAAPVELENPYAISDSRDVVDPGIWLLSPVPMAFLCFGVAALAARLARRRFEGVGAVVGLAAGIGLIAILQHSSEKLSDNLMANWPWLIAVTLLGVAGGSAARITGTVNLSGDRVRIGTWVAARMFAAVSLGSAAMLVPALTIFALRDATIGTTLGWLLLLALAGGIAGGGWIVGRIAPRFPVVCAIASVFLPYFVTLTLTPLDASSLDIAVGVLGLLSMPAAVAANIASSRTRRDRAQRDKEASGMGADLVRFAAFGMVSAVLLGGAWATSRATCDLQRDLIAQRLETVKRLHAPADALRKLAAAGLEARLTSGGPGKYEIEVAEPQSTCNLFSRRTIIARYPPAD